MRKIITIFLLISKVFAQTTPLTYTNIPFANADLQRPEAGANEWSYDQNVVNIPVQGTNTPRLDRYWRFTWLDFQPANGSQNAFSYATFDSKMQQSIDKGQGFSFGIMQECTGCDLNLQNQITTGKYAMHPTWLHTLMQAETPKGDYVSGSAWLPYYNSPSFLAAWKNLNVQLNAHILATTYKGVRFQDMIDFIDMRGYGNFGEWTNNDFAGGTPTIASLDSILAYQFRAYNTFQMVTLIATYDGNQLSNTMVPPAVGYFALTQKNAKGVFGWRRDNWGQVDNYIQNWLNNNNTTFSGITFKDSIMARYKYAPIVGEPQDGGSETNFSNLPAQGTQYGGNSFGNGNFNNGVNATIQNNFRLASKTFGYRLNLNAGGSVTGSQAGGPFQIVQHWRNVGVSPSYLNWNCVYDLRTGPTATPVWSGTSSFNPRLFSPAGSDNVVTDNFTLTSVPAGTYELHMTMKDPLGYRFPMPIYITNTQQADGSYIILTNIVVGTSGAVANAGPNQNITITSATLSGSSSTGATSYLWTNISGPNTPTITTPTSVGTTVTGLITGTYTFQLAINGGATSPLIDQVNVVVALPVTTANAGANQAIVPPTSSVTVNGSASTGPITSYLWTQISGPNTGTITSPTTVSTTITGLITGTYTFQLALNGGTSGTLIDQMNVTVSASPVASAGPDQTIQLPTNSVTVNGSGSTGASTYLWTRISGPNTPTITNSTSVSTTITGLIAGAYVFQLGINGGTTGSLIDQINITVNPATAIANAGNNQTITLPTSSVSLSGSASVGATSYSWTNVSGPNTPTITTPTTVGTTVTGLIAGTYVFQLSINSGASTATVQVKVLPAPIPIANAGVSQTITLPTSSVTVDGSGSTGNITSYAWSSLSGPNAPVFSAATSVSTNITGLIEGTYLIQLSLNGGVAIDTMRVYVNPAAPPIPTGQTIFTTQVPTGPTLKDVEGGGLVGIELGTKFTVSTNGFILGVRFYKTSGNSGTHIGQLYNKATGVLMGSATFVNESLTGWQTAVFATPIAVTAGTTYIAAYFSPSGFYTATNNYFTTAVVNAQMTALADGADGSNGVYLYSNAPGIPINTYQKSNYWVDALFSSPNTNPCNCHPRDKWEKTRTLNGF
jgi:Domain of unknown function (DUF4082)